MVRGPSSNCLPEQGFLCPEGGLSQLSVLHYTVTHREAVAWHHSEPGASQVRALSGRLSDLIRLLEVGHELEPDLLLARRFAEMMARTPLPSYHTDHLQVFILGVAFKRRPFAISSLWFLDISPPTTAIYAPWRIRAAACCAHNLAPQSTPPSPC